MKCECNKCLVYLIRYGKAPILECDACKEKSVQWKQDQNGLFYTECNNCKKIIAVDLNTPCELDPLFDKKRKVVIKSQNQKVSSDFILAISKIIHKNSVELINGLKSGIEIELENVEYLKTIKLLNMYNIEYVSDNVNLEEKYSFYKDCNYPYSKMKNTIKQ